MINEIGKYLSSLNSLDFLENSELKKKEHIHYKDFERKRKLEEAKCKCINFSDYQVLIVIII
jgi:hypothetical protein